MNEDTSTMSAATAMTPELLMPAPAMTTTNKAGDMTDHKGQAGLNMAAWASGEWAGGRVVSVMPRSAVTDAPTWAAGDKAAWASGEWAIVDGARRGPKSAPARATVRAARTAWVVGEWALPQERE